MCIAGGGSESSVAYPLWKCVSSDLDWTPTLQDAYAKLVQGPPPASHSSPNRLVQIVPVFAIHILFLFKIQFDFHFLQQN